MFEKYFNLSDQPFGATPDPRFLLRTRSHREALASLYTGFCANRGFTVLIAEPGMGKTTLLFEFLDHLRGRARTVFLFDTLCQPDDVLSLILQDLGFIPGETAAERHAQLNEILAGEARADRKLVVVIDEAQNLSLEALEAVRLLSNFETSRSKLMQVILSGQPQLADTLGLPEAAQLRQRISTICRLAHFDATETNAYIEHRLKLAGHSGHAIFTPSAQKLLVERTQGIPRIINTLCFNSLCLCVARNSQVVDEATILEAISDLQLPSSASAAATADISAEMSAPTPPIVPIPVPPFEASETHLSVGGNAHYVIAALLVLCITFVGAGWGVSRSARPDFHSTSAAVLNVLHIARKSQGNNIAPPESARENTPTLGSAKHPRGLMGLAPEPTAIRPNRVVVVPGQTLETIARTRLGNYDAYILRRIRALNPDITDPNHIEIGRTIRLPKPNENATSKVAEPRSQP